MPDYKHFVLCVWSCVFLILKYVHSRDRTQLPLKEHSSGVRYVSACNCGRKRGPREDPFTVQAANCDFCRRLGEERNAVAVTLNQFVSVFQPSAQNCRCGPSSYSTIKTLKRRNKILILQ
jgi:protein SMG8